MWRGHTVIINGGPGAISTADNFHCQSDCQFSTQIDIYLVALLLWKMPIINKACNI